MTNINSKDFDIPFKYINDGLTKELLLQGNNRELIKLIPDNSVELVMTDIPYVYLGIDKACRKYRRNRDKSKRSKVNNNINCLATKIQFMSHGCNLEQLVKDIVRVQPNGKVNAYIWCKYSQGQILEKLFNKFGVKLSALIVWNKTNHAPSDHPYLPDSEYCFYFRQNAIISGNVFTKHKAYLYPTNKIENNHFGFKVPRKLQHESVKPLFITRNLIFNSTKYGDTCLDMYMGSGTTGVACKMLGVNFIGMELEPKYMWLSTKRIEQPRTDAQKLVDFETKRQERMQPPAVVTKKATARISKQLRKKYQRIIQHQFLIAEQQHKAKFRHKLNMLSILNKISKRNNNHKSLN